MVFLECSNNPQVPKMDIIYMLGSILNKCTLSQQCPVKGPVTNLRLLMDSLIHDFSLPLIHLGRVFASLYFSLSLGNQINLFIYSHFFLFSIVK